MKTEAVYPSEFHRKVLAQEAPGGAPARLQVVIPSITRTGESLDARVSVLDADGYPSLACDGAAELTLPDGTSAELAFRPGVPAVGRLKNIRPPGEGFFRIGARFGALAAHSNPSLCTRADVPGICWGDPHVHTVLSACHADTCRSLNFCYTAARHVSGLDWVAAADHVSNKRCEFARWKEQRTVSDLYDDPPGFVTLPAYEASMRGGSGGDCNVYMARFPELFVDVYEEGNVKTLVEKLSAVLPRDAFFVVPHHTTRTGKHGEIPDGIYPGPEAMPLVEIHSKWGTSEYRGNPNPLQKVHPGPSYVQDFLARGMRLGFVAGTDTHATMPSGGGVEPGHIDRLPGLTAVFCRERSRAALFGALRGRHCYAASLERILLLGSVAGSRFGEERERPSRSSPVVVDLRVAAQSDIVRIELVRNGQTVYAESPESWQAHFRYEDRDAPARHLPASPGRKPFLYYYVRVTCRSGAQAWSSPVWLAGEN